MTWVTRGGAPRGMRLRCGSCGHKLSPYGLLSNELANGATGLAVIPTCKKVVKAGPLRNRSIGCSVGTAPQRDRIVVRCGRDQLAVRREGDVVDAVRMALER